MQLGSLGRLSGRVRIYHTINRRNVFLCHDSVRPISVQYLAQIISLHHLEILSKLRRLLQPTHTLIRCQCDRRRERLLGGR